MFRLLLRLFRRKVSVERLRKRWDVARTPQLAEELARAILDRGDVDEAASFCKEAYSLFPRAERIRAYYHHALRLKSSQEIRSLRAAIATDGRPEIYARLAELYRYLGHFEDALEIAHEGLKVYPESSGNLLAIGRIHYTRFLNTRSPRDGRQAAAYLTRACELDPQNLKTLFHLANLYLTVGDRANARRYLELLGKLVPGDSRLGDFWERLHSLPREADDLGADHFSRYEARKLGRPGGARFRSSAALEDRVRELASIRGVAGVCVMGEDGKAVAAVSDGLTRAAAQAAAWGILEGARVNSRRMSIGTFTEGVLNYGSWKIFLRDVDGVGVAVFGSDELRDELVRRKVVAIVDECLCETELP